MIQADVAHEYDLTDMTHPVWQKNIQTIQASHPELAHALIQTPLPTQSVGIERAQDGSFVLCIVHEGKRIPLNDLTNPKQSAREWVLNLGGNCLQNGHVMMVGTATGYHPLELFAHSDLDTLIWIVEPEIQLLKTALHVLDFRVLFQSKRVRWLVAMPPKAITERLFSGMESNKMRAQGIQLAVHSPVSSFYQAYIQELSQAVLQAIGFDALKFKTEEEQGKVLLKNAVDNLPYLLRGGRLMDLQSAAVGIPAWLIAPGPGLEAELPVIQRHHQNAIVIAVDTANRILHKHGMTADMVVSIDFTELNIKHFEGMEDDPAVLAAFVGIQSRIVRQYVGRTFFYLHSANRLIQSIPSLNPLGQLEAVGSTAHAAYLLARMMGCSPIVLVGNDLSFPENQWYAAGAMQLELEQKNRRTETLLDVAANDGGMVKTNALYKIYLDEMEKLIRDTGGNVINTSPHGAVIRSTRRMDFEEAVHRYCRTAIQKGWLRSRLTASTPQRPDRVMQEMQDLSDQCLSVSELMSRHKEQAESLSPVPGKMDRDIKNVMRSLQTTIHEQGRVFHLTIPLCTRSTVNLFGNLGQAGIAAGDSIERNKQTRVHLIQMFEDFSKALNHTAEEIQRGIRCIERIKKGA